MASLAKYCFGVDYDRTGGAGYVRWSWGLNFRPTFGNLTRITLVFWLGRFDLGGFLWLGEWELAQSFFLLFEHSSPFCLDGRVFFPVNRGQPLFCSIVSTCLCLGHHWCTSRSSSYPLSPPHPMIFRPYLRVREEKVSSLTLLTKFVSSILSRCPSHLSLVSPWWFSITFSFLLPTFAWCQPSSSSNIYDIKIFEHYIILKFVFQIL